MRALGVALATLAAIACAPLGVDAQPLRKIPRIGVLSGGTPATSAARHEALRQGLRDLGYVERQSIVIEYRYTEGKAERASTWRTNWSASTSMSS